MMEDLPATTAYSTNQTAYSLDVTESLYQVKLLAALRNGDVTLIHQLLTEPAKEKLEKVAGESADIGAAAVHLAIRCASSETVSLLLSHRLISPNAIYPSGSGTTALHLAALIGRADVVNRLLEQEGIDDMLRDSQGRTCLDVARSREVRKMIRDSRALLTASYRSLLHSYISSPTTQGGPPQALIDILDSPRVKLVDLSYLDPTSGYSLLHEAAIRKDVALIDKAIKAGADIFVRDRRGKAVGEAGNAGKDEGIRALLRQFTNRDSSLLSQPSLSTEFPTLKGYLAKYTNVARGYNTRWFVLKNGILSYYRHQDNENFTSRGSISMRSATLVYDEKLERLRFEVHSNPGRGQQRWYLKGNHPIEVSRWIQAIRRSIEYTRREASGSESDSRSNKSRGSGITKVSTSRQSMKETGSFVISAADSAKGDGHATVAENEESDNEDEGKNGLVMDDSSTSRSERCVPHEAEYELHGNATAAQAELSAKLLSSLVLPADAPETLRRVKKALDESVCSTELMINEYLRMMAEREEWWRDALARERQRGSLWEETLQTVVKEGAALENALKSRMRRPSRTVAVSTGSADQADSSLQGMPSFRSSFSMSSYKDNLSLQAVAGAQILVAPEKERDALKALAPHLGGDEELPERLLSSMSRPSQAESAIDTDEEDEFFDAIEANALPNVVVPTALTQVLAETPAMIALEQYDGYANLRVKLAIDKDTRPPTSLWSVLKHSIGKDLTRISFPVFFNEPTSMLQRMAEDMEFPECLDAASVEPNPHKRIAFVAAFAMSNYSSTIGRIAKPFNPMLGETFEYIRLDKKYRYMSEQVSHHPPISACWAESSCWHYFGEIDAQNKFMGKSFEIRPTGVAHVELLIPEEFGDESYPKAKLPIGQGKVIEHYSWKKVTTNVSGFILGSPTIDHYGDMTVVNHRTGDTCVLTFKPRGWRGKDAYEILGHVMNRNGNVTYEIAGRWNSQLVARAVGTGFGDLLPDVSVHEKHDPSSSPSPSSPSTTINCAGEYTVLWRNTVKPPLPFNLTPFAITLNDLPPTLHPYLPPTDCRLRPDQRAFELSRYEHANRLKFKQEEFQRATRRAREEGRMSPHRPRWFKSRMEPETGERMWEPARLENGDLEYWAEREAVWREGRSWTNVDAIFIHDAP